MKLTRRNQILAGVVLAFAAGNLMTLAGGTDAPAEAPLLDFDEGALRTIRITRAEDEVTLERSPRRWRVVERARFPAHDGAVTELLARLRAIRTGDLVSTDRASEASYGFGAESARLELEVEGGETLELDVASRGPGSGEASGGGATADARGSYVRLVGAPEVYRAAALTPVGAAPDPWLDTRLVEFDISAVTGVEIEGPVGDVSLARTDDGRWRAAGVERLVAPSEVDPVLIVLANLYFADVSAWSLSEAGLESPRWAVRLELDGGGSAVVHLGEARGGTPTARRPEWESEWAVVLPETSAERLLAALAQVVSAGS